MDGKAAPTVLFETSADATCVVHGDEFAVSGPEVELEFMRRKTKCRHVVKARAHLGPDPSDDKGITCLT